FPTAPSISTATHGFLAAPPPPHLFPETSDDAVPQPVVLRS
ncbi:Os11g0152600, partial [Oryza sativa Japonica Group]